MIVIQEKKGIDVLQENSILLQWHDIIIFQLNAIKWQPQGFVGLHVQYFIHSYMERGT